MKKQLLLVLTLLLTVLLAACGGDEEEEQEEAAPTEGQQMEEVEIAEEEIVDEDVPVVRVNGEEVEGNEYNSIYRQIKTMQHMYGQDVSDHERLKEQTVDEMISLELVLQDAGEQGIEVTEEEADETINEIREVNGEEVVTTMLEEYEMTEDELVEQVIGELTRMEYMEATFEVDVTEDEVREQFDMLVEQAEEISEDEFEDYETMIRQSITEQKQSEMMNERIEELREEAEIEVLI